MQLPPIYGGVIPEQAMSLSQAQRAEFAHMRARLELLPIVHGFPQLPAWRQARHILKTVMRNQVPLPELRSHLNRYRALERQRLDYARRETLAQRLMTNEALWQTAHRNAAYSRWQLHAPLAHWSVSALHVFTTDLLPFFERYVKAVSQILVTQETVLTAAAKTAITGYVAALEDWLNQSQHTLAHAMMARLQCVWQHHHTDCLWQQARELTDEDAMLWLPQADQASSFDANVLHGFSAYLSQSPLAVELNALPWFAPDPAWWVRVDARGVVCLPMRLHRLLSVSQPRMAFFPFMKERQRARLAQQWCETHQAVWLSQRLLMLPAKRSSEHDFARRWEHYQTQQVRLQQALDDLKRVLPHRWNWFLWRSRRILLVAQQTLLTHQQRNQHHQLQHLSHGLNDLEQDGAVTQEPAWAQIHTWLTTCGSSPQVQALSLQAIRVQHNLHERCLQREWQHSLARVRSQPVNALADWQVIWQHTRHRRSLETTNTLWQPDVLLACQALAMAVLERIPQAALTGVLAEDYSLWWAVQLLLDLGDASIQTALQTVLTTQLQGICEDALAPINEQHGVVWRTERLQGLCACDGFSHHGMAERLYRLSQTHHAQFVDAAGAWLDAQEAAVLRHDHAHAFDRWQSALRTRLTDTLGWKDATVQLFFECAARLRQGEAFALVMATTRRKIDWFLQAGLVKTWLLLHVQVTTTLDDPKLLTLSAAEQATVKRQLETRVQYVFPQFSLFHHANATATTLKSAATCASSQRRMPS